MLLYLAAAGLALALIDLDVHRLPDAIVLPAYSVTAVFLGLAAVLEHDGAAALRALLGGLLLYGLYFALAVAKPGGTGFATSSSPGSSARSSGTPGGRAGGGGVRRLRHRRAARVALVATGALRRRGHLPFGPSLLAGAALGVAALGVAAGGDVVHWYLAMSGDTLA